MKTFDSKKESFDSKKVKDYYKHLTGLFSALFLKNVLQTTSKFVGIIRRGLYISLQEKYMLSYIYNVFFHI